MEELELAKHYAEWPTAGTLHNRWNSRMNAGYKCKPADEKSSADTTEMSLAHHNVKANLHIQRWGISIVYDVSALRNS